MNRLSPSIKIISRRLRSEMTDAERHLWRHLRMRQTLGVKFRRQHPLGSFVLDFACLEARLAIEVDGGQHAEQVDQDAARTAWIESHGWQILRFWNNDVLQNIADVMDEIHAALSRIQHP